MIIYIYIYPVNKPTIWSVVRLCDCFDYRNDQDKCSLFCGSRKYYSRIIWMISTGLSKYVNTKKDKLRLFHDIFIIFKW